MKTSERIIRVSVATQCRDFEFEVNAPRVRTNKRSNIMHQEDMDDDLLAMRWKQMGVNNGGF
jgi:hypothetical protein